MVAMGSTLSIAESITAVRRSVHDARAEGRLIAFVPTMGALHAGHISLIEAAVQSGAFVVVSIYVNPTQFGPKEDFQRYPRPLSKDVSICEEAGVNLVFTPSNDEMYPPGDQTRVMPGPLADTMCGLFRPGHFEGVCTVVAKLFNIVQAGVAYFGQKDAQQALIIKRMVEDLRMPIRIEVRPTVREPDGLAMSSRNTMLQGAERQQALCLYRALRRGEKFLRQSEGSINELIPAICNEIETLAGPNSNPVTIDYIVAVDPGTLKPVDQPQECIMLAGAIRVGSTRLIDNIIVDLTSKNP